MNTNNRPSHTRRHLLRRGVTAALALWAATAGRHEPATSAETPVTGCRPCPSRSPKPSMQCCWGFCDGRPERLTPQAYSRFAICSRICSISTFISTT